MYKCGICGQTSQQGERIGGRVPLAVRAVEYHTPKVTPTGRPIGEVVSTGVETVHEVIACTECAASPPTPETVDSITITQPTQVIDRRRNSRGDNSQDEGAK